MTITARPILVSAALALAACGSGGAGTSSGPSGPSGPASPGTGTVSTCTKPVLSSAGREWQETLPSGYMVFNNVWGGDAGPQSIHVCSEKSWYVVSNQPVIKDSPGEIKTYPCSVWDFEGRPLSAFTSIVSTYGEASPASGVWNASYDIWLGPGGYDVEVMVWNDYRYPAPLPPGNATDSATPTIDGQSYYAWTRPNGENKTYIALAMNPMHTSGSIEFRHIFDWLVAKGWLEGKGWVGKDIPLNRFEYGIEIGETGTPMTFALTDFSVTATTR